MQFQLATITSNDFELFGVAWRPNEICYAICVAECVFSTSPGDLIGYQRLEFEPHTRYDESFSDTRCVYANMTAKANGSSPPVHQLQAMGPVGNTAIGRAAATTGLGDVVSNSTTSTPTGKLPRTAPLARTSITVSTPANIVITSKQSPVVVQPET